jgi:hypothetical protein
MLDDHHGAVSQQLAAGKHGQDRPCLVRRVGRVHEDPTKDPALGSAGYALQGA